MTPRKPLSELEADEFVCTRCQAVSREHPADGMGECPDCAAELTRGAIVARSILRGVAHIYEADRRRVEEENPGEDHRG